MKTILFASLLSLSAIVMPGLSTATPVVNRIHATADAPAAVKAAFTKLYPAAKNVKFEKENGDYEAAFTQNGKSMSVVMDAQGTLKETETTIAVSALPASVRDYVAKNHAGKKIKEAAEIIDAKGVKTYEAEVGGKDLMFDQKGAFIK